MIKGSAMLRSFIHSRNTSIGRKNPSKKCIPFCSESKGFEDMTTDCMENDNTTIYYCNPFRSHFRNRSYRHHNCNKCNHADLKFEEIVLFFQILIHCL